MSFSKKMGENKKSWSRLPSKYSPHASLTILVRRITFWSSSNTIKPSFSM